MKSYRLLYSSLPFRPLHMNSFSPSRWTLAGGMLIFLSSLRLSFALELSTSLAEDMQAIDPLPPLWPSSFLAQFDEENYYAAFTLRTAGVYYYDSANERERIDRDNGVGDRYCGSALPFRRVPCSHLVIQGERYLIFKKSRYCCKCCDSGSGCGILRRDWLNHGVYVGKEEIEKQVCYKWNRPGMQNNFFWQAMDGTPMRVYMEPNNQMTFRHDTYNETADFPPSIFELPTDISCSSQCRGVCDLVQRSTAGATPA